MTPPSKPSLADLGPLTSGSGGGNAKRIRLHHAWYRAAHIGDASWGSTPGGRPDGSILSPESARDGKNFLSAHAAELFAIRRTQGWGVEPVRITSYMTSSQALLINLMGPLGADPRWLLEILEIVLARSDLESVDRWEIEYAPRTRSLFLNDMTRVDALFWITSTSGPEMVVLELKYIDRFSTRIVNLLANHHYGELADASRTWHHPSRTFAEPNLSQLVRCHALGLRVTEVETGAVRPTTILLIALAGDTNAAEVFDEYQKSLTNPASAKLVALETALEVAKKTARTPQQLEMVRDLVERYIEFGTSDYLWSMP